MKVRIKMRSRLQAGEGIEIANAEANTIISRKTTEAEAGYVEGAAVEVVQGSDSKLVKVVQHSTYATPTAFPTILKTSASGVTNTLDSAGIKVSNGTLFFEMKFGAGGHEFNIGGATNNLYIREVDACGSGVPKKMLIIGSDPY